MKEPLRKLVIATFALSLSITTSVLVMQYGWGLKPVSWGWIIGAYLVGNITAQLIALLSKD